MILLGHNVDKRLYLMVCQLILAAGEGGKFGYLDVKPVVAGIRPASRCHKTEARSIAPERDCEVSCERNLPAGIEICKKTILIAVGCQKVLRRRGNLSDCAGVGYAGQV